MKNDKNRDKIDILVVVPIVLYNGKQKWDAPMRFKDMSSISSYFGDDIIDFKYNLIDVNNGFSKEELSELKNITGAIFLLDQKVDIYEFIDRIVIIAKFFYSLTENEKKVLLNWLNNTLEDRLAEKTREILLSNQREVVNVVANNSNLLKEFRETEKIETAKAFIKEGATFQMVLKATGLDEKIVKKLFEEIKGEK